MEMYNTKAHGMREQEMTLKQRLKTIKETRRNFKMESGSTAYAAAVKA